MTCQPHATARTLYVFQCVFTCTRSRLPADLHPRLHTKPCLELILTSSVMENIQSVGLELEGPSVEGPPVPNWGGCPQKPV